MTTKLNLLVIGLVLVGAEEVVGQPAITTQPQDQTNYVGTTATFTVAATGTGPLLYQWQTYSTNFTDIPNNTNAVLTLCLVQTNDAADYRVVVTDATGTTNSATAHLYVVPPERLFISQSAPGMVTLSWKGNMVLMQGTLDFYGKPFWFQVTNTSPVQIPIQSGAQFFTLWVPDWNIFWRDYFNRCGNLLREGCEDCIKHYFMLSPGPWLPNAYLESAAILGADLGSPFCLTAEEWVLALRNGIQPPLFPPVEMK